jgi:DNA-binding NarL/FixJ family response regulator
MIEANAQLVVVGEAGDGESALCQIETLHPDIAVLDIDMPKMDGFAVAREMQRKQLAVHIVFLTMHAKADLFHAAMDLGARGYILKDSAILEVAQGLLAVARGQHYVSAPLTVQLLNRNRQVESFKQGDAGLSELSEYERRILRMVAHNKSSKEIADELCIQYRTVENRRTMICQKLGLHGSNALLKFALEHRAEI